MPSVRTGVLTECVCLNVRSPNINIFHIAYEIPRFTRNDKLVGSFVCAGLTTLVSDHRWSDRVPNKSVRAGVCEASPYQSEVGPHRACGFDHQVSCLIVPLLRSRRCPHRARFFDRQVCFHNGGCGLRPASKELLTSSIKSPLIPMSFDY